MIVSDLLDLVVSSNEGDNVIAITHLYEEPELLVNCHLFIQSCEGYGELKKDALLQKWEALITKPLDAVRLAERRVTELEGAVRYNNNYFNIPPTYTPNQWRNLIVKIILAGGGQ